MPPVHSARVAPTSLLVPDHQQQPFGNEHDALGGERLELAKGPTNTRGTRLSPGPTSKIYAFRSDRSSIEDRRPAVRLVPCLGKSPGPTGRPGGRSGRAGKPVDLTTKACS